MYRVTESKGFIILHITLKAKTDSFGVTEISNVNELLNFFENCKVISQKEMRPMLGLNHEIVMQKA